MKNYILLFTFFLPLATIAQKIKIKDHEVFVNDSIYCLIEGKTNLKAALQKEVDFTVSSLQGEALINVKSGTDNFYDVTFLTDGRKMKYKKAPTVFNIQKDFIKKMVNGGLLEADTINSVAKEKFRLEKKNADQYNEVAASTANGIYNVTERNINESIKISDETIQQDGVVIGSYIIADEIKPDGTPKSVVTFYLPNETKVAKLDVEDQDATNNDIVTFRDNSLDSIDELSGNMNANKEANVKKAALWLIRRGYL